MTRYHIEQIFVLALGFFVGAALAVCVAPGDILLWVAAGIALSIFSRAFFIRGLAGELLWPVGEGRQHRKKTGNGASPTATQH
ncbi:MAG: hypothetical protein ABSF26_21245 [Thermoguttaceae bacterium]|jgi:hypothetical protein